MQFPESRLRRLRRTESLRRLCGETHLAVSGLVYPLFMVPGKNVKTEITSMPGQHRLSVEHAVDAAKAAFDLGISAILLFGIPRKKDAAGSEAWDERGVVQEAISRIKHAVPQMTVIADACFCEYTTHGHCGVLVDGELSNDATLENLGKTVVSYATAGADMVAPSGMLDGFVMATREALDEADFGQVAIMAYSAKYASAYYGPFRDAAHSAPEKGDRKSYQMDPANWREAIREVSMDVSEGADIVMIKPALAYLDVISRVRDEVDTPLAAYNVSGEYALLQAGKKMGWIDYPKIMMETLLGIRRAGADIIITYHAMEAARLLR